MQASNDAYQVIWLVRRLFRALAQKSTENLEDLGPPLEDPLAQRAHHVSAVFEIAPAPGFLRFPRPGNDAGDVGDRRLRHGLQLAAVRRTQGPGTARHDLRAF